jgi:hypothetical protein
MKKVMIAVSILISSCVKNNVEPKFDTRILATGTKCTISPNALGKDDNNHSTHVTVDSMSWHDSYSDYYFVAVTTDDGKFFRYPDEDLIDCK